MVKNTIQDIEPVVRVPWMVVWGNSYVRPERVELLAAGFMLPARENHPRKTMSTKTLVCTSCGYYGKPTAATKGSFLIEIVLWLCFIIPGLIYSLWRVSSRQQVCPKCHNSTLIPADSPMAKKALADAGISETQIADTKRKAKSEMSPLTKKVLIVIGVIFLIVILYNIFEDGPSDATQVPSQNQQAVPSSFELGTYRVESEELNHINPKEVNIFKSFTDRSVLGKLKPGDVVEVTQHDPANNYCQISFKNITGWIACGWLKKSSQ